jgi:hypothetical protein
VELRTKVRNLSTVEGLLNLANWPINCRTSIKRDPNSDITSIDGEQKSQKIILRRKGFVWRVYSGA